MRPIPVVVSALLLGALAPAWASDSFADIDDLAGEHMATCVAPYIEASLPEQDALLVRLVESQAGDQLLARLRDGAPEKWRTYLADGREPLQARVEAAVNLIGMAISERHGEQKAIARAYSAYFLSAATQGQCPAPAELADFVATNTFWPAQPAAPNHSATPILPISPSP